MLSYNKFQCLSNLLMKSILVKKTLFHSLLLTKEHGFTYRRCFSRYSQRHEPTLVLWIEGAQQLGEVTKLGIKNARIGDW